MKNNPAIGQRVRYLIQLPDGGRECSGTVVQLYPPYPHRDTWLANLNIDSPLPDWWPYPGTAMCFTSVVNLEPETEPDLPEQGPCLDHYLVICRRPDGSLYPLEMSTSLDAIVDALPNIEGIWRVCHIEGDRAWNETATAARLWVARHPECLHPGSGPMPPFVKENIK